MKRFTSLMLMLLMAVTTWAQTFYTLGERKTSFSNGDKVLIYSTCRVNGETDFTGFYKNVANNAKITFYKPATIGTFDDSYVWTVNVIEDTENYTKVSFSRTDGKYWGIGSLTSNATVGEAQTYYITQWKKSLIKGGEKAGGDVYAEDHEGNAVSQTDITDADPYFAVQCENGKCLNTNGRQYQSGNSVAYPIVFYSVNEAADTKRPATANDITNEKKYVVAANEVERGAWCFKADDEKMYSTDKNGRTINRNDVNNQFAFITFNGETYLYSVGKQKFVHRNPGYTERTNSYPVVSDTPTTPVSILQSTSGSNIYRYVVAFNINGSEGQIGVSNSYTTGIITDYNDLGDGGNSVEIVEAGDFTVTDEIRNAILEKQLPLFKAELAELATELEALSQKTYYPSNVLEELTSMASAAKTTADAAASTDDVEGLYTKITAAKSLILRVKYVTNVNDFSNNAVYSIVSKYNNGSYVMYDASKTTDYAISSSKYNDVEKGESVAGCQWAVYKSDNEKFYLYNIGAKKFMGKTTDADGLIPMSDKPTANDIIFKASTDQDYHMMISVNNGAGSLNHNNGTSFTHGLLNWNGGWGNTSGAGNVHKITVIGALDESTLEELGTLVANYEAGAELRSYLDEIKTNYYDQWANGGYGAWRITEGMNNYSQQEGDEDFVTAYNTAREYLNGDVTVEGVQQHKNKMAELIENLQINQPESNNYYRLRCVAGQKYMSSNVNENGKTLMDGNANDATSIFYYDGAFMTYVTGRYISAAQSQNGFQLPVGERKGFALYDGKINNNPGSYLVQVNSRYLYGKNNVIDQGSNQPTNGDLGYNWWLEEVTELPVTITAAGYATLFAPVALTVPSEVKAYTVTINGEWATLNEITSGIIPAETGVIIAGANGEAAAAGTYKFAITTTEETLESDLRGSVATTYYTEAGTYYALAQVDGVVGFYKDLFNNNRFQNNSHKAYLYVAGTANAASYSFRFGEGTTGINEVTTESGNVKGIYDLTGRRVEAITAPGIYVVNGKKVLVK